MEVRRQKLTSFHRIRYLDPVQVLGYTRVVMEFGVVERDDLLEFVNDLLQWSLFLEQGKHYDAASQSHVLLAESLSDACFQLVVVLLAWVVLANKSVAHSFQKDKLLRLVSRAFPGLECSNHLQCFTELAQLQTSDCLPIN